MGASVKTGTPHEGKIELSYTATWGLGHGVKTVATADPFGPTTWLEKGEQQPALGFKDLKPVWYVPVPRRSGKDIVPDLTLQIAIWEKDAIRNVVVPALAGSTVEITVVNRFQGGDNPGRGKPDTTLKGQLNEHGISFVSVPASKVAEWLDPKKPFGGRVNEVLLDFSFKVPAIADVTGAPLMGQSQVRIYLYCRKVVVFLPGVFGTRINVLTPDGTVRGWPDFFDKTTVKRMGDWMEETATHPFDALASGFTSGDSPIKQHVGVLECDELGKPLLEAITQKLTVIHMGPSAAPQGYDLFRKCHEARVSYYKGVPDDFTLIQVWIHGYDWRGNLEECFKPLVDTLKAHREKVHKLVDFDDQFALAGHSTGGVIMRGALGEKAMNDLVSHAFFLNVPFQGAVKPLGVILTGLQVPGGEDSVTGNDRMIKVIGAESMRAVALSMPIVYHLAPTAKFGARVGITPNRPAAASVDVEADKRAVVEEGLATGMTPIPWFVKSSVSSPATRATLAGTADHWHAYREAANARHRGDPFYEWVFGGKYPKHYDWFTEQEKLADIAQQKSSRVPGSWNVAIAQAAINFHRNAELVASRGDWQEKAFVFYSISDTPTVVKVTLQRVGQPSHHNNSMATGATYHDAIDEGNAQPRPPTGEVDQNGTRRVLVHQWTRSGDGIDDQTFAFWAERVARAGDATVPIASLRGFGGPATIFKPITDPKYTDHAVAPNAPLVWNCVIRALQGIIRPEDVEQGLEDYSHTP